MLFIYVLCLIIVILFIILIQNIKNKNYENFTTTSIPTKSVISMISSYWNKYIHFGNKRSKCIDCDKTSDMDHPYREVQLTRSMS
jgi:hypothetical protein